MNDTTIVTFFNFRSFHFFHIFYFSSCPFAYEALIREVTEEIVEFEVLLSSRTYMDRSRKPILSNTWRSEEQKDVGWVN